MTTFVLATEWGVSYTCGSSHPVRLNVHKTVDEPNRWGGRGVLVTHPEFDGLYFTTKDEAKSFAIEVGLLRPFVPGEALKALGMTLESVKAGMSEIVKELDASEVF